MAEVTGFGLMFTVPDADADAQPVALSVMVTV